VRENESETCLFLAFSLIEEYFDDEIPDAIKRMMP
jgi:hypothetical protein